MSSLAPSPETAAPSRPSEQQQTPSTGATNAYVAALSLGARLPLSLGYPLARLLGRSRRRRLARAGWPAPEAARALGADPRRLEDWARLACELRASDDLEALRFGRLRRGRLERLIRVEGLGNLDEALAAGSGAILFSAHVEGRHLVFARLCELGYQPTVIGYSPASWTGPSSLPREVRERRNRVLEREFGCRFSFMEPGNVGVAVKAANALRRNGVVIMLVDLPHEATAVEVGFFAARTRFSMGPALVAQSTGAPLLDFHVRRPPDWLPLTAEIGAPLAASTSVEDTTQRCAARIEAAARRHPPPPWKYLSAHPWDLAQRPRQAVR